MGDEDNKLVTKPSSLETVTEQLNQTLERQTWLSRLEATRADHTLKLAHEVERDADSRDRQTEAVLAVKQKLTEIYDQREEIRSGQAHIITQLALIQKAVDDSSKQTREATQRFRVRREDKPHPAVKLFVAYARAPRIAQVLVFLLVLSFILSGSVKMSEWIHALAGSLLAHH